MDVHDVSSISYNEPLQPGMIITVEPGLYMPEEEWVPEAFRGIGVRIEDDVLITTGEPEILTHEAPKEVDDLENIIGANPL
jgi:Xaa-Pro aminopeptidase